MSEIFTVVYEDREAARRAAEEIRGAPFATLPPLGVIIPQSSGGGTNFDLSLDLVASDQALNGGLLGLMLAAYLAGNREIRSGNSPGAWLANQGIDAGYLRRLADRIAGGRAAVFVLADERMVEQVARIFAARGEDVLRAPVSARPGAVLAPAVPQDSATSPRPARSRAKKPAEKPGKGGGVGSVFAKFAGKVADLAGHPSTFATALGLVVVWAMSGPLFGYSDTWQLVINTGTTVITFLMVFVIQNAQNRDSEALQVKLDELLRVTEKARNIMIGIEKLSEAEVRALRDDLESQSGQADDGQEETRKSG